MGAQSSSKQTFLKAELLAADVAYSQILIAGVFSDEKPVNISNLHQQQLNETLRPQPYQTWRTHDNPQPS